MSWARIPVSLALLGILFPGGLILGQQPSGNSTPRTAGGPGTDDASASGAIAQEWALPETLSLTPGVRDPVFSLLIGLVEDEGYGQLTQERLYKEIDRVGRPTHLPVEHLEVIHRFPHPGPPIAKVRLVSFEGIDVPVPYRILVYHPGRLWATRLVEFEEWYLGTLSLELPEDEETSGPVVLEDVRLWGLRRGRLELDVDGWVDALLGPRLDDTRIVGFAMFRHEGRVIGIAMGYNKEGKGRSGSFSFLTDKVNFPNPPPFRTAAVYLRARLERLMPNLAVYRRG